MDMTKEEWLSSYAESMKWVIEMAHKGLEVADPKKEDPKNVFLHMIESEVNDYLENNKK